MRSDEDFYVENWQNVKLSPDELEAMMDAADRGACGEAERIVDEAYERLSAINELSKNIMSEISEGFTDNVLIGENDLYQFAAGRLGGQWFGYAVGQINKNERMAFLLPGCDEDSIDYLLPEISDDDDVRNMIIKRVGAVAAHFEHGYGGIERWFVEEDLRGTVYDFECAECGSVACSPGDHNDYDDF